MFLHDLLRFLPRKPWRGALDRLGKGDFDAAAALFETLLDEHERPPADLAQYASEADLQAARRRRAAGDLPGALQRLERAAALRPGFADVQFILAQVYEESERASEARAALERAVQINPRYFEARLALARVLTDQGEAQAALRHLQVAAQTSPPAIAPAVAQLLARGDAPATRDGLEQLCERTRGSGTQADAVESVREALRNGQTQAAIAALQQLLQAQPGYADLHNLLGIAYDQGGMVDDAVEEFERALGINPEYTEARLNLGVALLHRGHAAEAERQLRRIERTHPERALVRALLDQIAAPEHA